MGLLKGDADSFRSRSVMAVPSLKIHHPAAAAARAGGAPVRKQNRFLAPLPVDVKSRV